MIYHYTTQNQSLCTLLLTFRDTNKQFEKQGGFLNRITNKTKKSIMLVYWRKK